MAFCLVEWMALTLGQQMAVLLADWKVQWKDLL
jgi:hypothetical protein